MSDIPSWIPILVGGLLAITFVGILSCSSVVMLLLGLREVRTGTFNGRAWGSQYILLAVVFVKVQQEVFAHIHRGLLALGIAVGVLAAILLFRRAKPTRYPRSRLWLWIQMAITLALAIWVFIR